MFYPQNGCEFTCFISCGQIFKQKVLPKAAFSVILEDDFYYHLSI